MLAHLLGAIPFHLVPRIPTMGWRICIHLIDIDRAGLIFPHPLLPFLFLCLLALLRSRCARRFRDDITNVNIILPCRLVVISTGAHAIGFGKYSCHLLVIRIRVPVAVYIECLERCANQDPLHSLKKRRMKAQRTHLGCAPILPLCQYARASLPPLAL